MKLHEHQGKELLARYGVPVPRGRVAFSVDEAVEIAKGLTLPVVVKAQIHAGGRGKGGGVKLATTQDEVRAHAKTILGMQLKTKQTGPAGQKVQRLLIEEGSAIARELYVGITLDRSIARLVFIASTAGGMEIEEVAEKTPAKIVQESIDPRCGLTTGQAEKIATALALTGDTSRTFVVFAKNFYHCSVESDATLAEINPLVVTKTGTLLALDAKIAIDDNALFRHPDLEAWRDLTEEDPAEIEAKKWGLSYIRLSGNIGCMVNGAGLAMATMDIIKLAGGMPANFLDVGGSATKENVTEAFKIILRDPHVKAILVNIFGGIMKCDVVAAGIVAAAREQSIRVPLVVRLQGTHVEAGKNILSQSGLNIISADLLAEAAEKAVSAL